MFEPPFEVQQKLSERSFVHVFSERVAASPARIALRSLSEAGNVDRTWAEWDAASRDIATSLIDWGLKPGDRVAILSNTRAEWCMSDMAALMAGGTVVPIYPSKTPRDCHHILQDSGARVLFVERASQLAEILEWCELPRLERVIAFESGDCGDIQSLDQALSDGRSQRSNGVGARLEATLANLRADDLATIVYTSGTTGLPKGACLTHRSLAFESEAVGELNLGPQDVQLLFLPLAHAYGRLMMAAFIRWGGLTAFPRLATAQDSEKLFEDLQAVKPTVVGSVPMLYERVYSHLHAAAEQAGGLQRAMFTWACEMAEESSDMTEAGAKPSWFSRLRQGVADRIMGRRLRGLFGGRIRLMVSGQATLAPEVIRFFVGFGLEVLEGYGMTETMGATHVNRPAGLRLGTVGQPLAGIQAHIASDGEILVRGPNVMRGYYNQPEATRAVLNEDGWFSTGDIGEVDEQGYLRVTARKRDLIITPNGKRIAPQRLETVLQASPYIRHAVVHGSERDYLTALITLDEGHVGSWARLHGLEVEPNFLVSHPQVYTLIEKVVSDQNTRLSTYETIRKFAILDRDFTQKEGELTPTMQLRRDYVTSKYRDLLDSFYTEAY